MSADKDGNIETGVPEIGPSRWSPVPEPAKIRDRMPLMLPKEKTAPWIDPTASPAELLPYAVQNDVKRNTAEKAGILFRTDNIPAFCVLRTGLSDSIHGRL